MRIVGGILPWIGFRVVTADDDGEPCDSDEPGQWKADALEIEWFGVGAILYMCNYRK